MHTRAGARLKELRSLAGLGSAHSKKFERQITWIFGSPRSGSTWLFNMLNEHDAVVGIDEPLIGWYLGPFLSDNPGGDASALSSTDFTLRLVQAEKYSQFFAEQFSEVWVPGLARMMRERFFAHALRHPSSADISRRAVAIKEPNGSQSADIIMRALPRSRLLFLLRDGRDVVDSELSAVRPGSWATREFPGLGGVSDSDRLAFVIQSAYKWLWRTETVQRALAAHPGPSFVTRYEDLLSEPETGLTRLFAWLELDCTARNIREWVSRNAFDHIDAGSRGPQRFYRAASPGGWRENLRPEEQRVLSEILGAKLRELGYVT
jgi:hypothetical protein